MPRRWVNCNLLQRKTVRHGRTYRYWTCNFVLLNGNQKVEYLGRADDCKGALTRRAAMTLVKRREAEINDPDFNATKPPLLIEYLEKYLLDRKHDVSAGTLLQHRSTVRYLVEFFTARNIRLDEVSKQEARDFKTAIASGRFFSGVLQAAPAASTVDGHMRTCRVIFNRALEDELIRKNPFKGLCRTVIVDKTWAYVSHADFNKLLYAAGTPYWRALLGMCRLAGLRLQEAQRIEWCDVDFDAGILTVISKADWRTKTGRSRRVPMPPELRAILEAVPRTKKNPRVVAKIEANAHRTFEAIRHRAKVAQYAKPFHVLRKSFCQDMAARVSSHVLQTWAGHTDFKTTASFYLKCDPAAYQTAAKTPFFGENITTDKTNEK